jgi:di/tripeptidase
MAEVETHPVQFKHTPARVPKVVAMRAYEVYREVFTPQEALVTGGCRGGFSGGELIAFLYARSFPKEEWDARFNEAIDGSVSQK